MPLPRRLSGRHAEAWRFTGRSPAHAVYFRRRPSELAPSKLGRRASSQAPTSISSIETSQTSSSAGSSSLLVEQQRRAGPRPVLRLDASCPFTRLKSTPTALIIFRTSRTAPSPPWRARPELGRVNIILFDFVVRVNPSTRPPREAGGGAEPRRTPMTPRPADAPARARPAATPRPLHHRRRPVPWVPPHLSSRKRAHHLPHARRPTANTSAPASPDPH